MLATVDGDRIRCDLCPRLCRLRDGQTGPCAVRRRRGDLLETATFATTVSHLGPIERKPFYHYRPGSAVLTLAAPGCTFTCDYCINFAISQYRRPGGAAWSAAPVDVSAVIGRAAAAGAAVGLSYTEPSLALELTCALADVGRAQGVDVVWKSNGYLTEVAVKVAAGAVKAVNIDVKGAFDNRHRRLTGGDVTPVFAAIAEFRRQGVWVEVTTPLIPDHSAEPAALAAIAERIAAIDPAIPWHLMRFTPVYRMTAAAPTTPAALRAGTEIGRAAGLLHIYVERALGPAGRSTRCPQCATQLVDREIWRTTVNRISDGRCSHCSTLVKGVWT
ncbi:AmmeMemoRadiSam system radical SAM enzyme [Actinoplanes sp. NPDC004185]